MVITGAFALLVFGIIVIISALLAYWYDEYHDYDKGSFHSFIVILGGLSILITLLFYYSLLELQVQQQELISLQEFNRVNDMMLNSVLDAIQSSSIIIPNFVLSITPLTNENISIGEDPINPETSTKKMTLSYRIFSLWQNLTVTTKCTEINADIYVANFLQRANSNQLYTQWLNNKLNFSLETQTFGDLLFEYGLPITTQTTEEYNKVANLLIFDPRFKQIIN